MNCPEQEGHRATHSSAIGRGLSLSMKLVQPKATWPRSLRVKVKTNAFEDVLQANQEGRVGRNPSIFVYFSQHKVAPEKTSNATT